MVVVVFKSRSPCQNSDSAAEKRYIRISLPHRPRLSAQRRRTMPLPAYLPHLLYATAVSSLALHYLNTKKETKNQVWFAQARISVLEDIATRLRAGEDLPDAEIERLKRLTREDDGAAGVMKLEKKAN